MAEETEPSPAGKPEAPSPSPGAEPAVEKETATESVTATPEKVPPPSPGAEPAAEKKEAPESVTATPEKAATPSRGTVKDKGPRGRDRRDGGGDGGRGRGGRREKERESEEREFQETLVAVYRCSATVKGGRRLSFGAMVTVGDRKGRVGVGYGKAKEVPGAIQKAIQKARKSLRKFPISTGGTIPHQVTGVFGASRVILVPARPGTGLIAGGAVKAILEAGGLANVLTKSVGSNNTRNIVKAVMDALESLRSKQNVESLRGVELP